MQENECEAHEGFPLIKCMECLTCPEHSTTISLCKYCKKEEIEAIFKEVEKRLKPFWYVEKEKMEEVFEEILKEKKEESIRMLGEE